MIHHACLYGHRADAGLMDSLVVLAVGHSKCSLLAAVTPARGNIGQVFPEKKLGSLLCDIVSLPHVAFLLFCTETSS